jgi:predicted alpha/beta hydrolase family esterase
MITFILPGFSPSNKSWVDETARKLKIDSEIRPVYWDHWMDTEKTLKPKAKAQDIVDIAMKEKINIIAKSVGTLVAAYVADLVPDQINKIILCGVPSTSERRLSILKDTLEKIQPDKLVVFQNTGDPLASFGEVRSFINKLNQEISVVEKPLHSHDYPYFEDFQKLLS